MSWMRSNFAGSAAGMACNTTSGAGGFGASCCEEHPTREIPSRMIADTTLRSDLPITVRTLPHHRGYIILRRPDQRNEPSNHAPPQKEIEQEDRQKISLAPSESNNRRQKIHHKPKAEEREEEEICKHHSSPPFNSVAPSETADEPPHQ